MKVIIALATILIAVAPRANAAVTVYASPLAPILDGATGTGSVTLEYDDIAHTLGIDAGFSGLSGETTVAHLHCCTANAGIGNASVAVTPGTLPSFPVGVSASNYSTVIDLTDSASYTGGFLGAGTAADAEAALIAAFDAGKSYLNIHSSTFGGGEIRGYLEVVPEPGGCALMLAGLVAVVAARRRS